MLVGYYADLKSQIDELQGHMGEGDAASGGEIRKGVEKVVPKNVSLRSLGSMHTGGHVYVELRPFIEEWVGISDEGGFFCSEARTGCGFAYVRK